MPRKTRTDYFPEIAVVIRYSTKRTHGFIECSIAFFNERFKKFQRLMRGVKFNEIYVFNRETNIVYKYFDDLSDVPDYYLKEICK